MSGPGGGGDANVTKAVEKLIETIDKNNEVTEEYNQKIVSYNKSLVVLTWVIGTLAAIQLCVMIIQMACSG